MKRPWIGTEKLDRISAFVEERTRANQKRRRATTVIVRITADGVLQLFEAVPEREVGVVLDA